jgi:hypothetical protein
MRNSEIGQWELETIEINIAVDLRVPCIPLLDTALLKLLYLFEPLSEIIKIGYK